MLFKNAIFRLTKPIILSSLSWVPGYSSRHKGCSTFLSDRAPQTDGRHMTSGLMHSLVWRMDLQSATSNRGEAASHSLASGPGRSRPRLMGFDIKRQSSLAILAHTTSLTLSSPQLEFTVDHGKRRHRYERELQEESMRAST